jgi:hypothetical protein
MEKDKDGKQNIDEAIKESQERFNIVLKAELSMEKYHGVMHEINQYIDLNMIAMDLYYKQMFERQGIHVPTPEEFEAILKTEASLKTETDGQEPQKELKC